MSEVRTVIVGPDEADQRLDRWFKRRFPDLGHGRLQRLLRTGQVRVDGRRVKAGTRLAPGQAVRIPPLPAAAGAGPRRAEHRPVAPDEAAALRAAILFKDDWVIAIDKPAGLATQGGTGQRRHIDAMLDALRFEAEERPRLVHRLDKDTSGVLLLARTALAARRLSAAFRGKEARKIYWALVVGVPAQRRGHIDLPLGKRMGAGGEKVRAAAGRPALTLYRVVQDRALGPKRPRVAWLALTPMTGRTHQLRAHCAALGTPILGDGKYGGRAAFPEGLPPGGGGIGRMMLHAREIALPHPDDGTTMRIVAPLAPDMAATWANLGFDPQKGRRAADDLLEYAAGVAHSPPAAARSSGRREAGRTSARRAKR